ncbi:MAG: hypothetical protein IIV99_06500, partial [Oscillospiraceae bacterium]|nr:hypothetical protein [Oscillospiraceae bacterium]
MKNSKKFIFSLTVIFTFLFVAFTANAAQSLSAPKVTASNVASSGKICISWDAVDGAEKYYIYRAESKDGSYSFLASTTGTSAVNTEINAGETYYYYVRAVDENGKKSARSNIVARTCDLARPVVTIGNIASTGKIKISWNAVDGASKYVLYHSTTGKTGSWTAVNTTKTSITHSSAKEGTTYYYKVKALHTNSSANSAYSSQKSRTCDVARPVPS